MGKNYERGLLNEYHLLELRNIYLEKENKQLKYEYGLSTLFWTIFIRSTVVCIELVFDNQENREF